MSEGTCSFLDWFCRSLADAGMKHAFGVPGGGTSLDLLQGLKKQDIETVITAREDAAVIMAGVSGVLAGAPGVAFTTKGPGLANAANGLASAALDRLPALLISEAFGKDELSFLSHQVLSQSDVVRPLLENGQGRELKADQDEVADWIAHGGSAPAAFFPSASDLKTQVPEDIYKLNIEAGKLPDFEPAAKLLTEAKRPVVVVGLEAARSTPGKALRDFVAALGAPVLVTYMAKGSIADEDPCYAGIFTGGAIEQPCMTAADLFVLVGLDPVELIRKPWTYEAPVLDICERRYDPHYLEPAARVEALLSDSLSRLVEYVPDNEWTEQEIAKLRADYFQGMSEGETSGLASAAVVKALNASFDNGPRLAVDAGAHMFSACAFWPAKQPNDLLISNGLATMGFAVPAAIAAALHDPERGAIALTGDGGFLMCLGELKTAAEQAANLTVVVFNDGRLSLIDIKREDRQMPDLGLSWSPPDFATVAKGFGFQSWQVNDASELSSVLDEAAAASGPRLVDIRIDASGYRDQMKALRG